MILMSPGMEAFSVCLVILSWSISHCRELSVQSVVPVEEYETTQPVQLAIFHSTGDGWVGCSIFQGSGTIGITRSVQNICRVSGAQESSGATRADRKGKSAREQGHVRFRRGVRLSLSEPNGDGNLA